MGAKYDLITVGKLSMNGVHWPDFLSATQPVTNDLLGSLSTVMVLNVSKGKEFHCDLESLTESEWDTTDQLSFYPLKGLGVVTFSQIGHHWEFSLALPVELTGLNDALAETTLLRIWKLLQPLSPKLALAGEEMDVGSVTGLLLRGEKSPLDVPLCDFAILSDDIRVKLKSPIRGTQVPNGVLVRKQLFFGDRSGY